MTTPATNALRFRIWQHCQPLGWNVTLVDLAEVLDEDINRVRAVVQHAGWSGRLRSAQVDNFDPNGFHLFGTNAAARAIAGEVIAGRVNLEAE